MQDPEYVKQKRLKEKEWTDKNRDKVRKQNLKWQKENRAKVNAYHNAWQKKRTANDPTFRLNMNISRCIRFALNGEKHGTKWQALVGYSLRRLKNHLEKHFTPKMSWSNYSTYWQIDHVHPLYCFGNDTIKAWALKNLRPLEAKANRKKSNNLILE